METKIDKQCMEKVRRSYGFSNGIEIEAEGSRGGICLVWKEDIKVTLRSFSKNHIDVMVKEENTNVEWRFIGFYGSPYINCKNDSWTLLRKLGEDQSHPWQVKENFNEIMYTFEKVGGTPRDERKIEAFQETLEDCQLEDIGYSGVWFTWERGNFAETNIKERLERGVVNENWKSLFPTAVFTIYPSKNIYVGNSQFKFEAWWTTEESLEEEIKASWESTIGTILEKLEKLQENLKESAGSIKKEREGLKRKLTKELEMLMAKKRDDDTIAKIIKTKVDLNMEIDRDEIY
ncbi:reverse transcriptase [Gossypium australe]|uniref:Reverse transcriptase n=1 Tax=Gossypium australe TaxID=47621 RepID=A0A5B6WZE1_9ROSI|nr:reverse transcriptase [Gossypium australe]